MNSEGNRPEKAASRCTSSLQMRLFISCRREMKTYALCHVFLTVLITVINSEKCATPDSKEGECVELKDCQVLSAYLLKNKWSTDDLKFFRRSRCPGIDGEVCCQVSNVTKKFVLPPAVVKPVILDFRIGADEFSFPDSCGEQIYDDERIIGETAALGEFPWMALLKYKTSQGIGYACGGSLINSRHVITAAHCVSGLLGEPFEVTLGEYDTNSITDCNLDTEEEECAPPPQNIPIEKIIKHPDYLKDKAGRPNDIALLKLKKTATYTDYIMPICLSTPNIQGDLIKPKVMMKVSGWGETRNRAPSNIKMKANVPIVDRTTCSKGKTYRVAETQICAGGGKEDSCAGDSGGPLMVQKVEPDGTLRWYMTGIVSLGPRMCATKDAPGVYTNVASYIEWIKVNMKP